MKREENRRDFLKRISTVALAIPFLSNCAIAQKEQLGELDLIRKNAMQGDCNWCGAKDVSDDVTLEINLCERRRKGRAFNDFRHGLSSRRKNSSTEYFNLRLPHGYKWNLRKRRRAETRTFSRLDVDG